MYGRRPEARDWVWKSSRRWPPSGWRVRCSLMPAAMLEIHDAALRVLWGLLEANPLRRCARRRRWAPSTIDYTHHDQKKDRARQPPATLAPSHPKPLHAGNSQAPACGAPASRRKDIARHRLRRHPRTQSLSTPATASRQPRGGWGVGRGLPTAAANQHSSDLTPPRNSKRSKKQKARQSAWQARGEVSELEVSGRAWGAAPRPPPRRGPWQGPSPPAGQALRFQQK